MDGTTRRRLLAGVLAGAALPVIAGCGSGGGSGTGAGGGSGSGGNGKPWSFTDDLDNTAKLDSVPTRIVAYVAVAAGLADHGVDVIGTMGDMRDPVLAGDLDPEGIESLGVEYDEFNIERYLRLNPEVLITMAWAGALWFVPENVEKKLEGVTPIVAMEAGTVGLETMTKRFEELAVSLGGDPDAEGKRRLREVSDRLSAMAKQKQGLSILPVSGGPDQMWVSRPSGYPALSHLRKLGFDVIDPGGKDPFFREYAYERAGQFDGADVIFHDVRTRWLSLEDMKKKPAFAELPAVAANQVVDWHVDTQMSYTRAAIELEAFADQLEAYEPLK